MAEQHVVREQNRTKEGILVIPLDEVRAFDYDNATIASGAWPTSGILYAVASGKEAYLRQIQIQELSGYAGNIQIVDAAGNAITPPYKVAGGQLKLIDTCLGPVTSGFTVASGAPIAANVTLAVQVDPKVKE